MVVLSFIGVINYTMDWKYEKIHRIIRRLFQGLILKASKKFMLSGDLNTTTWTIKPMIANALYLELDQIKQTQITLANAKLYHIL